MISIGKYRGCWQMISPGKYRGCLNLNVLRELNPGRIILLFHEFIDTVFRKRIKSLIDVTK